MRRSDLETSDIESIWIEIMVNNSKPILCCSVYRPPSANSKRPDRFNEQIEKAMATNCELYIMGDININLSNEENSTNMQKMESHYTTS